MNGSRIRGKMRGQIVRFSGEVSGGLCKTARRFVCEVLYGITASESVMLSEIGRTLDEEIRLKKTETRLSSQLGREKLKECVERNLLSLGASRIGRDTLLIVDISDIAKPYACRMEYLAEVRDGSVGQIGVGYWTVQVVGAEVEGVHITPLVHRLYSQNAPGFVSENEEILGAVRDIGRAVGDRGILVIDRGGDRERLLYPFLREKRRFMVRLVGNRNVEYRGELKLASAVAARCPMYYVERVVREENRREKVYHLEYGFVRVRLPEADKELTMVVVKGFGAQPMMLLTNVEVVRSRRSCWFVVQAYLRRWQIEETIRCMKQSYDIENVRLLTYGRLRNMMVLVLCAMYFAAVCIGEGVRLGVLAHYALEEAQRFYGIPNFRYYALAVGLGKILRGSTRPFGGRKEPLFQEMQLSLFGP
jgi:hypothetical protein